MDNTLVIENAIAKLKLLGHEIINRNQWLVMYESENYDEIIRVSNGKTFKDRIDTAINIYNANGKFYRMEEDYILQNRFILLYTIKSGLDEYATDCRLYVEDQDTNILGEISTCKGIICGLNADDSYMIWKRALKSQKIFEVIQDSRVGRQSMLSRDGEINIYIHTDGAFLINTRGHLYDISNLYKSEKMAAETLSIAYKKKDNKYYVGMAWSSIPYLLGTINKMQASLSDRGNRKAVYTFDEDFNILDTRFISKSSRRNILEIMELIQ